MMRLTVALKRVLPLVVLAMTSDMATTAEEPKLPAHSAAATACLVMYSVVSDLERLFRLPTLELKMCRMSRQQRR